MSAACFLSVFAMSKATYSDPTTLLETMLECSRHIDELRANPERSKDDVLDAWERRMGLLVGKLVAAPTCTCFCLWREREL